MPTPPVFTCILKPTASLSVVAYGVHRPKQLGLIREFIADNPSAWEKLTQSPEIIDMGGIQGDSLVRPPRGYQADAKHIEDLKRKSFYLMTGSMQNWHSALRLLPNPLVFSVLLPGSITSSATRWSCLFSPQSASFSSMP